MSSNRSNMIKMGKYIAKLRKAKGYTQKELSELLDVSDKTISKWERGDIAPDITILRTLAKELDSTVDDILCGEENIPIENQDESSVNMINIYSEQTKKKMIKEMVIGIVIALAAIIFIFYVENYYKWDVKRLKYDGDVTLRGYIFSNKSESKLVINSIAVTNSKADNINNLTPTSYKIEIYNKKDLIFLKEKKEGLKNFVNELFGDINIVIDNLPKNGKNEYKMIITIITEDNKENIYSLTF